MEGFFETLGTVGLALLVVTGALAGLIAAFLAGGHHRALYVAIGIVGAVAIPFVLAALGLGLLAAGGLAIILVAALIGAVATLLIARLALK